MNKSINLLLAFSLFFLFEIRAQDTVRFTGSTLSNIDYHHGQLAPIIGTHNIQVLRANREFPETAEDFGWTYNHAPMLAYWNGNYFLQYLADPVGEHIPPSQTFLLKSKDGYNWSKPEVLFPPYKIPDGYSKKGRPGVAKDLYAIMHQRMGFYVSKSGRLLTVAYYGIAMDEKDDPNDGQGVGRVVREIYKDGTYGPIYFIRYNESWDKKSSVYPFYNKSKDKEFVAACNELLSNPLMMMQWVEEADRDDPLIPLKKMYKAFSYYHLPNNDVVGLWKHALTTISKDGGKTWPESAVRAPGFVNSNAKIWGQRISDKKYVTVYNPSEYRWPLALSVSDNGLDYYNLFLINGEISPMRYGGNYKSYGPQYVRGIQEGNGIPPDQNLWVTYSMNKEDIWISKVPVPIDTVENLQVNDDFDKLNEGKELDRWNIYSPVWANAKIELDNKKQLVLRDKDPYDYAKAERVFPSSAKSSVEFALTAVQNDYGQLDIELVDRKGSPFVRLTLDSTGVIWSKAGSRYKKVADYEAGKKYVIKVSFDTKGRSYTVSVNGKEGFRGIAFSPVKEVERILFRTGEVRRFPHPDTPADQTYDLPNAGNMVKEAVFKIDYLKTEDVI